MATISIVDPRGAGVTAERPAALAPDRRASALYDTDEWMGIEDWLTVLSGFLTVVFVLYLFYAGTSWPMPAFRWTTDSAFVGIVQTNRPAVDRLVTDAEARGEAALATAGRALQRAIEGGDRAAIGAAATRLGEAGKGSRNAGLAKVAGNVARDLGVGAGAVVSSVFSLDNLWRTLQVGFAFLVVCAAGVALIGRSVGRFLLGFPIVYGLAWLAQIVAGNSTIHYLGIEYVVFALVLGLAVSNLIGVPGWLMEAVRTEYYIRSGLVVLGANILFFEILQAGWLGIVQAVIVVMVVWYVCFWLARRLGVEDGFAAMLSTAVSICGVSAAIAAYGAIRGDRKQLSYVTSLVLIVAVPMMILQPWIARLVGMPDIVAGAWLGGTLDTSASVVAAGALISDAAMKVGTIVKFSQNVLIGVVAFLLACWWVVRHETPDGERPRPSMIWGRFPKFVLGFMVASCAFSFLLEPDAVAGTRGLLGGLRTVWFALAFTCIGLETRFTDLVGMQGGRPAVAFLVAQLVNVVWALLIAYLLFGGVLVAVPKIG
jgi:uncharacterized membrane protein YadS